MSFLERLTTKYRFADGATIIVLHRYALRFEHDSRSIEIGFEQALEPGVDRLIHEGTIAEWIEAGGVRAAVSPQERADILGRVRQYCAAKNLTYRVVPVEGEVNNRDQITTTKGR